MRQKKIKTSFLKAKKKPSDKILIITMGCSKNTVDSEKLMQQLSAQSIVLEYDKDHSDAKTVIINTCGFIDDAKKESINTILHYAKAKQSGQINNLYVIGCLSQRYANELKTEMPEVDQFFGVNSAKEILNTLGYNYRDNLIGERLLTTPGHYAYLKISEGCNRKCAFCAIPLIRGSYKSETIEDIVKEAKSLAKKGVKELMVIAQDISYYGIDLYDTPLLAYLINKLSEINGIEWIRLHYAYPAGFPKDMIAVIRDNPKVCKYLDIPFQHVSDKMLKTMRRGIDKKKTLNLIKTLRDGVPDISLRTTILTGHPGETERDFNEMVEFVREIRFERLGIFTYSHEEGTFAARQYQDSISNKLKNKRAETIMAIQQSISEEIGKTRIGKEYKVIIDRIENDFIIGRTEFDSPEVDNEVLINYVEKINIGQFYNVRITGSNEFDLFGIPVKIN
jgi:ribosomal protein S12 methylthiotransferase